MAEQLASALAGGLQASDRFAPGLSRGHRTGKAELGHVVDHPAHLPDPARAALKLREVRPPDAVAARRWIVEGGPAGLGELAALGLVAARMKKPALEHDPMHAALTDLIAIGDRQRPDLAMPPRWIAQRIRVHDDLDRRSDRPGPRPLHRRPTQRPLTPAIPSRARDPRHRAEALHAQPAVLTDHFQLLVAKPAAPSRSSSRRRTCASPSAVITPSSSL